MRQGGSTPAVHALPFNSAYDRRKSHWSRVNRYFRVTFKPINKSHKVNPLTPLSPRFVSSVMKALSRELTASPIVLHVQVKRVGASYPVFT